MTKVRSIIKFKNGFSLTEIVLTSGLFALLVAGFAGIYFYGLESSALAGNRQRAIFLAEEGLEASRNIRDSGFNSLSLGTFGLATSGSQWVFSGGSDVKGIFTRSITVSSAGTDRKDVTVQISWPQNQQRTGLISLTTRLTNWIKAGLGNWNNPVRESFLDLTGAGQTLDVFVIGDYAYATRQTPTNNFLIINITNPAAPVLSGSLTLAGTPRHLFVSSNYAFVASSENTQELQIINVTNPTGPYLVGFFNDTGNEDAVSVFVSGPTAFLALVGGNELVAINISNPSSPALLGVLNLASGLNDIYLSGNYLFAASTDNTQEVIAVNVTNPAAMSVAGFLSLPGNNDALALTGFGTKLALIRSTLGNLYLIEATNPAAMSLLSSVAFAGPHLDVSVNDAGNYIFLVGSNTNADFKVIDATNLNAPVLFGSLNLAVILNSVDYDQAKDRAFVASADPAAEFISIMPQ